MRTLKYSLGLIFAASLMLLNSCNDDDLDGRTGVRLIFKSSTPPATLKSASVNNIDSVVIEEALIGVEKIKFKPLGEDDDVDMGKIVFNGPYAIDLLNGNSDPAINWAEVEPGLYKEIELETEDVLDDDMAVVMRGTIFFSDLTEAPFEFITGDDDFDIEVENDYGFNISEGVINDVLVIFNLSDLFNGIDLSSAVKDENGVFLF
ncbi:MAG: DUF4382 domain-containing protein, partial [Prolixibacteraceae bacterium]|nr:DUF4382 domain-containing protein [Prolixibacteraceae bacterium]